VDHQQKHHSKERQLVHDLWADMAGFPKSQSPSLFSWAA
jgi:hypothetical protein